MNTRASEQLRDLGSNPQGSLLPGFSVGRKHGMIGQAAPQDAALCGPHCAHNGGCCISWPVTDAQPASLHSLLLTASQPVSIKRAGGCSAYGVGEDPRGQTVADPPSLPAKWMNSPPGQPLR